MSTTANRVYDAPSEQKAEIPAYKIVHVEGPFDREVYSFDEKTRKLTKHVEMIPDGYMVVFPRGHSLFYSDLEALEANGYGEIVPLIRMDRDSEMSKDVPSPATKQKINNVLED